MQNSPWLRERIRIKWLDIDINNKKISTYLPIEKLPTEHRYLIDCFQYLKYSPKEINEYFRQFTQLVTILRDYMEKNF
ncbi:MAG: hypothetical protein GX638_09835 [Crenarchaeota archaeon]|nr:hypothetical protein [Thermoproteota archaeon]